MDYPIIRTIDREAWRPGCWIDVLGTARAADSVRLTSLIAEKRLRAPASIVEETTITIAYALAGRKLPR